MLIGEVMVLAQVHPAIWSSSLNTVWQHLHLSSPQVRLSLLVGYPATSVVHRLRRRQMTVMASRITGQSSVCSTGFSDWQQRNIKGWRYCPFVRGIHRWPVDSPHKGTVTENVSMWWRHNAQTRLFSWGDFLRITLNSRSCTFFG